ncbi:MAG: hypothetical protein JWP69_86 [Flaviaesturariibacter sp.]|nr:hypothetical protein [Flaviaesturariibacter sp.]
MYKIGILWLVLVGLASCKEKEGAAVVEKNSNFNYTIFSEKFRKITPPYGLSDTFLLNIKDTATVTNESLLGLITDSIKTVLFGEDRKIKYIPLAFMEEKGGNKYFILKAMAGSKQAALLMAFDKSGTFGASMPFLQPDGDPATHQVSSIDRGFSITRITSQKQPDETTAEGKDVYIFNPESQGFTLILTDALNAEPAELINPIDTLAKTNPLSGDYFKDSKSIVSIRDARNPNEFNFFIHFEKGDDCTGELKGSALMTSSKTAVFRQGGNPCVMEFSFSGSRVTIKEIEGCGSQRGIGCSFDGAFVRKTTTSKKKSTQAGSGQ